MRTPIRWLMPRLLWGLVFWGLACLTLRMTIPWAILGLILSYGLQSFVLTVGGIRTLVGRTPEMDRALVMTSCMLVVVIISVPVASGIISWTSGVANAEYVDEFITRAEGPLFEHPIADDQVRLVTDTLAEFVARRQLSVIGSNVEIAASHITTRNGRLVWVCVVVSTNVLAENYIQGLVVVDANDPEMVEVITNVDLPVGEGLFWDRNIQFANYLEDAGCAYEYAYPTWDPTGALVYIQTRTQLGADFVERPLGPKVYCSNGTVRVYPTLDETPDWITQAYSEEWFERQISRWGSFRRDPGFDLFAGGLLWVIQPSRDRVQMTEDTRYIINPDTGRVEAMAVLHPPDATKLTLSGIMRGTKNGIYYYDMRNLNMVSGQAAINEVIQSFAKPTKGSYVGGMPLLYPVSINATYVRQAWYCPIYWYVTEYDEESEEEVLTDFRLYALAIVDALRGDLKGVVVKETKTSTAMVQQARLSYVDSVRTALGMTPPPGEGITLTATALNVTSYVYGGDTYVLIRTDNSTYPWIEGTRAWMNLTDWYELLTVKPGDTFRATIQVTNGQFRIVAFVKL